MRSLKRHISTITGKVIRSLPLDSLRYGTPRFAIDDVPGWVDRQRSRGAGDRFIPVTDPYISEQPPPIRINPEDEDWFAWNRPWKNWGSWVLESSGLRWTNPFWGVITRDHGLLSNPSYTWPPVQRHPLLEVARLPKPERVPGRSLVLSAWGAERNYFEWMTLVLPRIHLLRQSGMSLSDFDTFSISHQDHNFQKETLEMIGIPHEQIIASGPPVQLVFNQAVVPSLPSQPGFTQPWAIDFMQRTFLGQPVRRLESHAGRRVYLSRPGASVRSVTNEEDLLSLLSQFGFEVVDPGSLTVTEQARTFSETSIVVAPHGAGLTNLVFMPPAGHVIELHARDYYSSAYWWICCQMGHTYAYLNSVPGPDAQPNPDQGITVPIDLLAGYLEANLPPTISSRP